MNRLVTPIALIAIVVLLVLIWMPGSNFTVAWFFIAYAVLILFVFSAFFVGGRADD